MSDLSPIIILTRPIHQSEAFRDLLGTEAKVIVSPVLEIRQIPVDRDVKNYDGMIFTSGNAVAAAANSFDLGGMKAFVVGEKTAEQARLRGVLVTDVARDSDALVGLITAAAPKGKLLHMRGRYTAGDMKERLVLGGIETDSIICYEQNAYPLSIAAKDAFASSEAIILPLFSPRSAAILSADLQELNVQSKIILVAISKATLSAWNGPEPAQSVVVQAPDAQNMQQEILRLIG